MHERPRSRRADRGGSAISDRPATAAADLVDDRRLDHLAGDLDGVDDRPRARRAVADDAHAVDAEQHRAAVGLGVERRVERQQGRQQRLGVRLVLRLGRRTRRAARGRSPCMPPSSVFSTTLPVNPSVTTTSTSSVMMSRPSTLPMKSMPGAGDEQLVRLLAQRVALARLLADRQQPDPRDRRCRSGGGRRPSPSGRTAPATRPGPRRWRRRRAAPSGCEPGTGIGVAIAGRLTPLMRPMRSSAAAIVAPVLPAEIIALAVPSRTASAARTSVESFLRRTPWAGSSSISMTSLASISGRPPRSTRSPRSAGPTSTTGVPAAAAARAPATIVPGAWSPPMASTAMGSISGVSRGQPTSTATRFLYQPQVGHTVCGIFALPQRGQVLRAGAPSFHAPARRLRVFDFDFFFFGTATVGSLVRSGRNTIAAQIALSATR